jgi:hypothetical protein
MFCNCDKKNCILASDNTYNKYLNKQKLIFESGYKTGCNCICCCPTNINRENATTTIRVNFNFNIKNPKCRIIKKLIKNQFELRDTIKENEKFYKHFTKINSAFERETVINLKLKNAMCKNLKEITNLKKEIKSNLLIDKMKNADIRKLKKDIRNFKKCIIQNVPDENLNNSDDDDDNDNDDDDDDDDDDNDNDDNDDNDDDNNNDGTLYKYQQIKNYLCKNHMSISRLCRIQKIRGYAKNQIHKAFIKLQIDRVKIAHPQTANINSNRDLINTILN